MNTLKEIAEVLKGKQNILIFPHVNMDGDALGSASGLCKGLRNAGKNAYVLISEDIPHNLDYLEKSCCINDDSLMENVDIAIMVDCNGDDRIKGREQAFDRGVIKICVDHHESSSSHQEYDYFYCEPDSAATGELIYLLLCDMGIEPDLDIAECLYTAITTDTGNFQFSNTSKRSHEITSKFFDIEGFDPRNISTLLYHRRTFDEFKLENYVMNNLHFYVDGKVAVGSVTQGLLWTHGCTMDQADSIIQRIMLLEDVEIGILIKENENGFFKASLRSKDYANVAKVAEKFGGGGHAKAAGCPLGTSIGRIKYDLIQALTEAIER